jgi:hypothetical protein
MARPRRTSFAPSVAAPFLVAVFVVPRARSDGPAPRAERSCARQPALVGPCFTVHGRLSLYNGSPSARIWQIGSNRILGVTESRCVEPECPQMPDELRKMLNWEEGIFADFLVCPFTESKPEHMQFVCIESARNLHVRKLQ